RGRRTAGSRAPVLPAVRVVRDQLQLGMAEEMAQPLPLGREIPAVHWIRTDLERLARGDLDPVVRERLDLLRVVREEPDLEKAEVPQDLGGDAVVPEIRREAELEIRIDGVEPEILELVRAELVRQSDSPPLLAQV